MLKGDLTSTSVDVVLTDLAAEEATGGLHVVDDDGNEALVYFRTGLIYAVAVPGQRPQLGARLLSSNALLPEHLAEALEAQRSELQGWRLGELLVHLGFVEQDVVEAFVQEQVRDGITDLLGWTSARWRFRKSEKTREDVAPPSNVRTLLDEVQARRASWTAIVESVHGPAAVPLLAARGGEADVTLDPETWSLLCKIDGERTIAELARDCGFTLFEAGSIVRRLVEAGVVDVEEDLDAAGGPLLASAEENQPEPAEEPSRLAALTAAFSSSNDWHETDTADEAGDVADELSEFNGEIEVPAEPEADRYPSSVARVSEALMRAFDTTPNNTTFVDPFHVPDELRLRAAPTPAPTSTRPTEDDLRRTRIRQAAAAELAAAHADAEASRHAGRSATAGLEKIANVVDLGARRGAARAEAERLAAQDEAAARLAAEADAARLEAARLETEQAEAERAETARLEADAARLEAARLETEQAEAERDETARLAAEADATRLAAEQAEAERAEAERAEAERAEAERAEAERAHEEVLEADRAAARDETARLAAEADAARLAAEQAEAEAEAARVEADATAARDAAEAEAARLAAEEATAGAASSDDVTNAEESARDDADRAEVARLSAVEQMMAAQVALGPLSNSAQPGESSDSSRMASATAMLAEFSRGSSTTTHDDGPADEPEPARDDEPTDNLPRPFVQRDLADTASLLRELSSLGFEDETPAAAGARPGPSAPRPITSAPQSRKKRGLFGR